jgi:3-oxoacyl-[acyl-carrier-protein] synthase II
MKILGLSAITSLGVGLEPIISKLSNPDKIEERAKRAYSYRDQEIDIFDYRTPRFNLEGDIPKAVVRRLGQFAKLSHHSINLAIIDSGIEFPDLNRVGMLVGSGIGPSSTNHAYMKKISQFGSKGTSPILFSNSLYNTATSFNTLAKKIHGPCTTVSNFELSTTLCFKTAEQWLKKDIVDYVIVSIADEFYDYLSMGMCVERNNPQSLYNPLVASTKVPGEGGVSFILGKSDVKTKYELEIDLAFGSKASKEFKFIDKSNPLIVDFKGEQYTQDFIETHGLNENLISYGAMYGSFPTSGAIDFAIAIKGMASGKVYPSLNSSGFGAFVEHELNDVKILNLLHVGNRGEFGEIKLSR